jgi:drug/metabolite transporter (DMT)-like permease
VLPILLAAVSAAVWGTGDFCGGKATQRSGALAVTVLSQLAGLPVLAACVAIVGGGLPGPGVFAQSVLAGAFGFFGILLLYRGLSQGAMSVFAPVSGVTAAVVPLGVGLALDRWPSALALAGAGCAIIAIGLVSLGGEGRVRVTPRLVGTALAAGLMFGIFFSLLGKTGADAGLWPAVGIRVGSLGVGLVAVLRTRTSLRISRAALPWTAVAGTFDILANGIYLLAAENGPLSLVAPISSLYPASTVLLALAVDKERVRPVQLAGLGLAATALVLTAT